MAPASALLAALSIGSRDAPSTVTALSTTT